MLSLNKHIPIEYVKQSKKLQVIETEKFTVIYPENKIRVEHGKPNLTDMIYVNYYPRPTIADIIGNAEELFWERDIFGNNRLDIIGIIVAKCYYNKSIEEISKYIIENIKE